MQTLLRIDASSRTSGSHSRGLADYYLEHWKSAHPEGRVCRRDLASDPPPHLSNETIEAFYTDDLRAPHAAMLSDTLIEELKAADHLLISSPLYNLTLPSALKAYFDQVVRAGRTFDVGENGYVGLLAGKSATVITVRGDVARPGCEDNFQNRYLRAILRFMGVFPVQVVALEGTALDEEQRERALASARRDIDTMFAPHEALDWRGGFADADKRAIGALRAAQARAVVDGDAVAYAGLCTEDVQLLIPGHALITGREDFLAAEEKLFAGASFASFTKYPERIERGGDLVVETGRQDVAMRKAGGGKGVFAASQKYLHIYRHTAAGWRYAALMSNPCQTD